MTPPPDGSQQSFIAEEIDVWLLAAKERCAALHIKAAYPWHSLEHQEAFTEMLDLLQQSFEAIQRLNETLAQRKATACQQASNLVESSATLREKRQQAREALPSFASPPPEEIQKAENKLLELFRDGNGRERQNGQ